MRRKPALLVRIHVAFASCHIAAGLSWRALSTTRAYANNVERSEWSFAAIYSVLVVAIFVMRLSWYMDDAMDKITLEPNALVTAAASQVSATPSAFGEQ